MTRETKIGLLVGLAFIIVIGILLSDHMTSTTQPPQAQLTEAAPNVRASVTPPAANGPAATPTQVVSGQPITPSNPVLTPTEIRQPAPAPVVQAQPPVTKVEVGGPAVVPQQPVTQVQVAGKTPEAAAPTQPGGDSNTSDLEKWAAKVGEPLVPVGAKPSAAKPTAASAKQREYTAVAGDSLSKIAAKTLGTGSKANIELLIKANPSLQKNPDLVVEGRKYVIPSVPSSTPETAAATPEKKSVPVTELVDPLPSAATPATPKDGTSWYTVKDNDNLWKIASEQLGSGNAWTQIKEMNKDVLKGGDTVQKNMRLRLPPKPLASAN
jgi:nucleoid-associated protein YgaU